MLASSGSAWVLATARGEWESMGSSHSSGQIKDYEIGICWLPTKHAALRNKSKDYLIRNQDNVPEWNNMSTVGMLFQ